MAVNTPNGLTERQNLSNVLLQGDTWSSMLASIQVDNICKEIESLNYGYQYKGVLPVSVLAMVDDMIAVTNAGYRAQQMNVVMNVKSAEKRLQFGVSKCKSMLIGKNSEQAINNPIFVDKWKVEYQKVNQNEDKLVETFEGDIEMEKTEQQKYLGFILSSKGDNMKNIREMQNKSVWILSALIY